MEGSHYLKEWERWSRRYMTPPALDHRSRIQHDYSRHLVPSAWHQNHRAYPYLLPPPPLRHKTLAGSQGHQGMFQSETMVEHHHNVPKHHNVPSPVQQQLDMESDDKAIMLMNYTADASNIQEEKSSLLHQMYEKDIEGMESGEDPRKSAIDMSYSTALENIWRRVLAQPNPACGEDSQTPRSSVTKSPGGNRSKDVERDVQPETSESNLGNILPNDNPNSAMDMSTLPQGVHTLTQDSDTTSSQTHVEEVVSSADSTCPSREQVITKLKEKLFRASALEKSDETGNTCSALYDKHIREWDCKMEVSTNEDTCEKLVKLSPEDINCNTMSYDNDDKLTTPTSNHSPDPQSFVLRTNTGILFPELCKALKPTTMTSNGTHDTVSPHNISAVSGRINDSHDFSPSQCHKTVENPQNDKDIMIDGAQVDTQNKKLDMTIPSSTKSMQIVELPHGEKDSVDHVDGIAQVDSENQALDMSKSRSCLIKSTASATNIDNLQPVHEEDCIVTSVFHMNRVKTVEPASQFSRKSPSKVSGEMQHDGSDINLGDSFSRITSPVDLTLSTQINEIQKPSPPPVTGHSEHAEPIPADHMEHEDSTKASDMSTHRSKDVIGEQTSSYQATFLDFINATFERNMIIPEPTDNESDLTSGNQDIQCVTGNEDNQSVPCQSISSEINEPIIINDHDDDPCDNMGNIVVPTVTTNTNDVAGSGFCHQLPGPGQVASDGVADDVDFTVPAGRGSTSPFLITLPESANSAIDQYTVALQALKKQSNKRTLPKPKNSQFRPIRPALKPTRSDPTLSQMAPLVQSVCHVTPPGQSVCHVTPPEQSVGQVATPEQYVGHVATPEQSVRHVTPPGQYVGHVTPPEQSVCHVTPPEQSVRHVTPPEQSVCPVTPHEQSMVQVPPPFQYVSLHNTVQVSGNFVQPVPSFFMSSRYEYSCPFVLKGCNHICSLVDMMDHIYVCKHMAKEDFTCPIDTCKDRMDCREMMILHLTAKHLAPNFKTSQILANVVEPTQQLVSNIPTTGSVPSSIPAQPLYSIPTIQPSSMAPDGIPVETNVSNQRTHTAMNKSVIQKTLTKEMVNVDHCDSCMEGKLTRKTFGCPYPGCNQVCVAPRSLFNHCMYSSKHAALNRSNDRNVLKYHCDKDGCDKAYMSMELLDYHKRSH